MGRSGKNEGVTFGNGYPPIKAQKFEGDLPLIVIQGYDSLVSDLRPNKDRICRKGTENINPLLPGFFNGRPDNHLFFGPEKALLSPMGVKGGYPDSGLFDAGTDHGPMK